MAAGAQQGQRGTVVGVDEDGDVFLKLSDGVRRVFAASQLRPVLADDGGGIVDGEGAPPSTPAASEPAPAVAASADPAPAPAPAGLIAQPEAAAPEASSTATVVTAPATDVWPEGSRALRSGLEAEPRAASVATAVALGRFLEEVVPG